MSAIIIAGTNSGAGKTTLSLGLMAAFKNRGLTVQPFKSGPDFIDPSLHRMVTGRISRNLDLFMMEEEFCHQMFHREAAKAEISIVEGVMGMFDGDRGSSFALSESLDIPTILVINAKAMAQSAAALVKGFEILGKGRVRGVIANNIASARHLELVKESIEEHCDATFLGHLPRNTEFTIPSRHLGLHLADDNPIGSKALATLASDIEEHIDLDGLLQIAQQAPQGPAQLPRPQHQKDQGRPKARIAIARDKAFCFYYQENFELLEQAGAELVFFSPLEDDLPKNIDGLILSGGYPELYGAQLAENTELLGAISRAIEEGLPTYAECGGFMYLSRGIWVGDGFSPMVGIFDTEAQVKKKRASLGYRTVELGSDCLLGPAGTKARGHEFHYSTVDPVQGGRAAYIVDKGDSGYQYKNCIASYIHLHFGSNPQLAHNFVEFIWATKEK